jgi:hypothetical protein
MGFLNMELRNSGREAEEGMDAISSLDTWCCGWPDRYFASLMDCSELKTFSPVSFACLAVTS